MTRNVSSFCFYIRYQDDDEAACNLFALEQSIIYESSFLCVLVYNALSSCMRLCSCCCCVSSALRVLGEMRSLLTDFARGTNFTLCLREGAVYKSTWHYFNFASCAPTAACAPLDEHDACKKHDTMKIKYNARWNGMEQKKWAAAVQRACELHCCNNRAPSTREELRERENNRISDCFTHPQISNPSPHTTYTRSFIYTSMCCGRKTSAFEA